MSKKRINCSSGFIALLLLTFTVFIGCEAKGPVQRAGENVDKGIEKAKDAINPPGPAEKAGRKIDEVVNP